MYSIELQAKIADWRRKEAEGTLSLEELREAVRTMREGRMAALASASSTTRKKAAAAIPSADDMLKGLEGL